MDMSLKHTKKDGSSSEEEEGEGPIGQANTAASTSSDGIKMSGKMSLIEWEGERVVGSVCDSPA